MSLDTATNAGNNHSPSTNASLTNCIPAAINKPAGDNPPELANISQHNDKPDDGDSGKKSPSNPGNNQTNSIPAAGNEGNNPISAINLPKPNT